MAPANPTAQQISERLTEATIAALDLLHVYLGHQLGLYRTLAADGPATSTELAGRCGLAERYVREWLEQQAVAGIVTVDGNTDGERRFALPAGHAEALTDADSLAYATPLALDVVVSAAALPAVLDAFRTGGGLRLEAHGVEGREAISASNRPQFLKLLAAEWLPLVPGLVERLTALPPARVADLGCGSGWSTIAIALGFPNAEIVGVDLDQGSIEDARANAERAGVADRVTFRVASAADPGLPRESYDLVCAFETIHDMSDPVGALTAMRELCALEGTVLVADERVADTFTTDVDTAERFHWGWSVLQCLPSSLASPPAMGTGTVMRAPTLRAYAQQAGFADIEILPVKHDFWRFYRLVG